MRLCLETLKGKIKEAALWDINEKKLFGSAYGVIYNGEVVYKNSFGTRNPEGDEVNGKTVFRLASMTKPITAFAALILVERGLLSLEDKVSKYIPEFEGLCICTKDEGGNIIRKKVNDPPIVRDLLTHTSGIGSENSVATALLSDEDKKSVESTVMHYAKTGTDFEPASAQSYSGVAAFDVITYIIEKLSGVDYRSFLKKEIFDPCGMVDTDFILSDSQYSRLMALSDRENGEIIERKRPRENIFEAFPCTHYLGGAGLASTLDDYLLFAKLLLNKGSINGKRLITEETFLMMCAPYVPKEIMAGNERWGLGVRVITESEYPFLEVGTFGWSGAYGSHFWIDPKNNIAAVFMKNSLVDGGAGNRSAQNFEKAVKESLI